MKIAGITKIRNEAHIIKDTLNHFGQFCDAIYVYDDCSTDRTVRMCREHSKVKKIIQGEVWDTNRYRAEYQTRQRVLEEAQKDNPEWLLYFDADERIEFDFNNGYDRYDVVVMRLFDFYITKDDVNERYDKRQWLGPEYRNISMLYRNTPEVCFCIPDQREPFVKRGARVMMSGFVKHYGKAISVEEWEKTCEYYSTHWKDPYKTKWENRKGKAIHSVSDFGRPLIMWHEINEKGVLLEE